MGKKNIGIILGYILIFLEAVVGMLFTPILLKYMGNDEYGLYKLIVSWVSIISVLDFGLGGTITRYVVKYKAENNIDDEERFLGIAFCIYGFLAGAVIIVGSVVGFVLPNVSGSIPADHVAKARLAFFMLIIKTAILLMTHAYSGWLAAYERFVESKILAITNIALRLILVCILLPFCSSIFVIVGIDLFLTFLQLVANVVISKKVIVSKPTLKKWDWNIVKEIFNFTFFLFLASVINQFNSNIDSIILGIYSTTTLVGLYSCTIQIYLMYSSLSTAIQEVYLPSISKIVFQGADDKSITESLIFPSRMQVSVLLLALTGYILFGQSFLEIWIGDNYSTEEIRLCYIAGLIVMASSTVQLFQNTVTCVLKAKNMMRGRVLIIGISTAVNFILTMLLVPYFSIIGAAVGTAISMIFGYTIAVNIYYKIKIGIDTKRYFKDTLGGIWLAALVSLMIGVIINMFPIRGIIGMIVKIAIYLCIYTMLLLLVGLKKEERENVVKKIKNAVRRNKL